MELSFKSMKSRPSTPHTEYGEASRLEGLEETEPTRRQFLAWLGQLAAAAAVVGIVPLAGCESPNDTHRRVCKENPHLCAGSEALIDLNNEIRERKRGDADKDEGDAESGDSHGSLRCWKQALGSPLEWAKSHWETVFFTTGGATTHLIPGDTWIENFFGRIFPAIFTVGNGATRGVLSPETLYSLFMLFIDKWWGWGKGLVGWRRAAGGGGAAGGGAPIP